jgi:hypothetical protein
MLFGFVLISILAILRDLSIVPQVYVKLAALVFCVGGVVRMCWPWVTGQANTLSEGESLEFDPATNTFQDFSTTRHLLTPEQAIPIVDFPSHRYETNDLLEPASVTEDTTKLLPVTETDD